MRLHQERELYSSLISLIVLSGRFSRPDPVNERGKE
jgi:hypothetical protein